MLNNKGKFRENGWKDNFYQRKRRYEKELFVNFRFEDIVFMIKDLKGVFRIRLYREDG